MKETNVKITKQEFKELFLSELNDFIKDKELDKDVLVIIEDIVERILKDIRAEEIQLPSKEDFKKIFLCIEPLLVRK